MENRQKKKGRKEKRGGKKKEHFAQQELLVSCNISTYFVAALAMLTELIWYQNFST